MFPLLGHLCCAPIDSSAASLLRIWALTINQVLDHKNHWYFNSSELQPYFIVPWLVSGPSLGPPLLCSSRQPCCLLPENMSINIHSGAWPYGHKNQDIPVLANFAIGHYILFFLWNSIFTRLAFSSTLFGLCAHFGPNLLCSHRQPCCLPPKDMSFNNHSGARP